jgi:hypothetical protein
MCVKCKAKIKVGDNKKLGSLMRPIFFFQLVSKLDSFSFPLPINHSTMQVFNSVLIARTR